LVPEGFVKTKLQVPLPGATFCNTKHDCAAQEQFSILTLIKLEAEIKLFVHTKVTSAAALAETPVYLKYADLEFATNGVAPAAGADVNMGDEYAYEKQAKF
jgi:hypothetical protein